MKIIRDIICAKTNYDEMYNLNDCYTGKILIDNGLFEGIIVDPISSNERFVFGTIDENEFLELVVAENDEKTIPRAYNAAFNGKNYRGEYLAKTSYYEYPIGECQLSILDPYYYRSTSTGEIISIETHICHHQDSLNSDTKELYRTMIEKPKEKKKKKIKTTQN